MRLIYTKPKLKDLSQGSRIAFVRQFRFLTQDDVSDKLGLTGDCKRRTMTRYERGDRNPKDERLTEIANILNISFNSIKKYDYTKPIDLVYTLMWLEEFKKIKNELKYVNKIWKEYNDNINSINHYTKPANLGEGHDIIRPILWDYIIQMSVVNSETHNIIQFSRGRDELYESQFSQNAYFRSIKNFIDNSENNSNSIIVNLVSSLKIRKNRNRIRFENGGHYVSDDTMDNVYSKDIFEYTKTGKNFGYLLVDGRTIPVYTIVNNKTLSEIELNKFLGYNVNKVIEYYNDFKEEKHGIKKDSKRYLAK